LASIGIRDRLGPPDFANLLRVLEHGKPARPTLFEFFLNGPLYTRLAGRDAIEDDPLDQRRVVLEAFHAAGYDYATMHAGFSFPVGEYEREASLSLNEKALITDRASFEAFPWPAPDRADYSALDELAPELPDGMKFVVPGPGGVLENLIQIVGFDNLCYMLVDDERLVAEIVESIGSRLVRHYEIVGRHDSVGAMISNDDWGFKTQPMLSPAQMREIIFPWHRRIVRAIHDAGRPAILHSCGNLESVMDDIIDDMGYDAKHSYEDAICPVEEAWERWGSRIAILGGIDLDFVCRGRPKDIEIRSRAILQRSAKRGSYALGTGNSVPEYVPDDNYLAMIGAAV
jgi:uroporphyrinogen decarboxylase